MKEEILHKLKGLRTIEEIAAILRISKESALNTASRLKKEGYLTTTGGGKQKRIYKITTTRQLKKESGMFDIINKYSKLKVVPFYEHQVHGRYGVEDALLDAIATKDFRLILAAMRLFGHIKNWSKLYKLANEKGTWQIVGGLYSIARLFFRVRKMPEKYKNKAFKKWLKITALKNRNNFPQIQSKWKVYIPFNENDMGEIA